MADVLGAAELVQYQDGSIVSRTLLKQKSGNITAFAFDGGQGLSEHTVPHQALLHVVDGSAEVTVEGKTHRVAAGQLIMLPANLPHTVHAAERFKMLLTMVRS